MTTQVAEACRLLCNKITFIHTSTFVVVFFFKKYISTTDIAVCWAWHSMSMVKVVKAT